MIIIFCEGKNDIIFLHETAITRLAIDSAQVKAYLELKFLEMDIRNRRQRHISIIGTGGSACHKVAVQFARQFWGAGPQISIGVIRDLESGPVYASLVKYLQAFLQTKCRKHNVNPQITYFDSERRLTMSFRGGRTIIKIWTSGVSQSVEKQVSYVLKRKYPQLKSIDNEDEVIRAASKILEISKEEVIRRSVDLLGNEKWFNDFCTRLDRILRD